ncbi:MAG: glutathione S-transferase family protein [Beijerinckiaceae bacterium]
MTLTLVIANKAYSSWSLRPWILMRHFGIEFSEIIVPMAQETTRETMLRYAPTGKCPSLHDGSIAVWDSLAIIEYLAETFPDRAIWPRDKPARAQARALAAEMHSGFMPLRSHLPMNMRRKPAPLALTPDVEADVARIEAAFAAARLDFGAGGPFLFGEFSAADAMFAPVVSRFHTYAVAVSAVTCAYMEAMRALPAFRQWQAEADAEPWHIARYDAI